jgi:hypothetical protein
MLDMLAVLLWRQPHGMQALITQRVQHHLLGMRSCLDRFNASARGQLTAPTPGIKQCKT